MKKSVIKFFGYSLFFLLFLSCENTLFVTGLAAGFLYALVYCKQKPILTLFSYLILSTLLNYSLPYLLYAYLSVLPAIFLYVFYYFFDKKFNIWVTLFCSLVSQISKFVLYNDYITQIISIGICVLFFYICIVFLYPVLIRGLQYELSPLERSFMLIFIGICGAGAYSFSLFGFSLFYPLAGMMIYIASVFDKEKAGMIEIAYGLGASLLFFSFIPVGLCAVIFILYAVFSSVHRSIGALFSVCGFIGANYFIQKDISLLQVLPFSVTAVVCFIPKKYIMSLLPIIPSENGKFAMRTIINRDREDIERKINKAAEAFMNVRQVLCSEENYIDNEDTILNYIKREFCDRCAKRKICGDSLERGLKSLVTAAVDSGKAGILDAGTSLGQKCVYLPKMIAATNDAVKEYKKEAENKSGIFQGKEMIIEQLGGTAEILKTIATGIGTGYGFDISSEKKIKEQLSYVGVVVLDVIIYQGRREITVVVRKKDADKPQIAEILSSVLGETMTERERKEDIGGTVSITYSRMSKYGLIYGESSSGVQKECGDTKRAIKISPEKIMFVLSDGMGTGKEAERTSDTAVKLIESFYIAGFTHKAVFGCVSKLLSLRKKEDFSALDVLIADTQTGEFDFIKQGGRESYVITRGSLETVEGGTLPLGIIENAEPLVVRKRVRSGDVIIMVSDGIADRIGYSDMTEILFNAKTANPQVIADVILEEAKKKPGKEDDMTAIVVRVVKNY